MFEVATADWLYVRLHGHQELYSGTYGEQRLLHQWAARLRSLAAAAAAGQPELSAVDCFVFFDNTEGAATFEAMDLSSILMMWPCLACCILNCTQDGSSKRPAPAPAR